ncbi:MAG TPA: kelch repeat-containing protein, partial [Chloroflexota bacterium]|nr:kelch repeat-containing protein [Chloroflexota bacterium]
VTITSITPSPAGLGPATITVTARDDISGMPQAPTVTVAQNGAAAATLSAPTCTFTSGGFPTGPAVTATCAYTYTVTGGPDGNATVTALAVDAVGNSATTTKTFLIDSVAPVVNITSPTTVQYKGQTDTLTVTFDYTEANPKSYVVEVRQSGGGAVLFTKTVTGTIAAPTGTVTLSVPLTNFPDGPYDIVVTMTDVANQTGTDTEVSILYLDKTPPFSSVTKPAHGSAVAAIPSLSGPASDPPGPTGGLPSGLKFVYASLKANGGTNAGKFWNGTAWVTSSTSVWLATNNASPTWVTTVSMPALSALEQGSYTACSYAVDLAGNTQSPAACATFDVDKRPVVSATVPDIAGAIVPRAFSPVTVTFTEAAFKCANPGVDPCTTTTNGLVPLDVSDYGTIIRLEGPGGVLVPATGSYNTATNTYTITLPADASGATLAANTTYTIVVLGCTTAAGTCPAGVRDNVGLTLGDTFGSELAQFTRSFKTPDASLVTWNAGPTPATMPTARREFGAVTVNGKYYAIGGLKNDNTVTGVNERYDPVTNTWTVMTSLPVARHAPAVAAHGSKIYVFGGGTGTAWSTQVDVYDTTTNKWTTAVSMPTKRNYMAAAELNGKIYVTGGNCQQSGCGLTGAQTNLVEIYDPVTNTWTLKTNVAQMLSLHSQHTLTAANGRLWAVGTPGSTGVKVEIYNPATNTWAYGPDLPVARSLHAAGVMNGLLYVVGGLAPGTSTTAATPTNTVYVYDPLILTTGTWTVATSMPTARIAFGGSVGIVTTGNPSATSFIAAGGSLTTAGGSVTNSVDSGAGG